MMTHPALRALVVLGIAWSATAAAQTAQFGQPSASPAPAVDSSRLGAGTKEEAQKMLAAALAADPEIQRIRKQMRDALVAEGRGQFEGTMRQLAQHQASVVSSIANRLGVDSAHLDSGSRSIAQLPAIRASAPFASLASRGAGAGQTTLKYWHTEYRELAGLEGTGWGSGCDVQPDPGSQAGNPARVSAAATVKLDGGGVCTKNRWRYVTIPVPPVHEGAESIQNMMVTIHLRRAVLRVSSGYAHYLWRANDEAGYCSTGKVQPLNTTQSGGFEELVLEGITITCDYSLVGKKKGPIKFGPEIAVQANSAGIGAAMADVSVDKLEVQVIYLGPK